MSNAKSPTKKSTTKKKQTKKKTAAKKNKNKTSKQSSNRLVKQEEALQYRIAGLSYSKIAAQMKLSKSGCHNLVVAALKDSAARIETNADQLREMELARIDRLIGACYSQAINGSPPHLREIRSFMELRCKLLGIESPAVQEGENLTDDNSGNDGNIIIHNHYV